MLLVKRISSWIRNRFTLYCIITVIIQLFGAFVVAVASPFILRKLLLPSLVEYTIPLHFNFETCREQLAGVCSFPTAVVDFSVMENPKLSPGENYEMSIEIVLSESTISNVGIFQAIVELVYEINEKKIYRKSCFANRHHGVLYRLSQKWWNLLCRTLFFPAYFIGLLTMLDDHKLEVSFTDRLVASDLANAAALYVQLQNRFIEVESGMLFLKIRFGLLRVFLNDYPVVSSLLIIIFVYLMSLTVITFYWTQQALFGSFGRADLNRTVVIDETTRSSAQPESYTETALAQLERLKRSEIASGWKSLIRNDLRISSPDAASESYLHRRQRSKWMKQ